MASVEALMRRAAENGMPALGLTDQLSLGGAVAALEAGERYGVKPIIGCELPLRTAPPDEKAARPQDGQEPSGWLTLLAETDQGLRHLTLLLNRALGRAPRPHITLADLAERREGLIALLGGPRTELARIVEGSDANAIDRHLSLLANALGRERMVFEVVQSAPPFVSEANTRLLAIADFLDVPAIASNDVWHIEPAHVLAHDFERGAACEIARWAKGMRRQPPTAHFASPQEMRERFAHHPHLLARTLEIAERCQASIDLRRSRHPRQDFGRGLDANSFLWDLVFREATDRLGALTEEHKARLNAELNHIAEENLGSYVIALWQLATALDRHGALRGVGEGRLQSSLMAHVIGLTEVNPIAGGIEFHGFLEADGGPRLGLEVAPDTLPLVERQLVEIIGAGKVARVGHAPRTGARRLRRDVCEWAGLTRGQAEKMLTGWPRRTISEAEAKRAWEEALEGLADAGAVRQLPKPIIIHTAQSLQARRNPFKAHATEILISGDDLTTLLPLAPLDESDLPMAEVDGDVLDRLGLLRLEVRTPRAMAIVDHATRWIRSEEQAEFHPSQIPFDDADTWALIGRGQTCGLPGLDRISTKSLLRAAQPRTLRALLDVMGSARSSDAPPPTGEAILAFRCAHLKTHHPVSFMAAMLSEHFGSKKQLRILLREATALGIRLLAPDINMSQFKFAQEGTAVRAGLMCVRGMTPAAYASIERARLSGAFQDLRDLWERTDHPPVSPGLLTNLIKGGVLDSLTEDRALLLRQAEQIARAEKQRAAGAQALELFDIAPEAEPEEDELDPLDDRTLARQEELALGSLLTRDPLAPHTELIQRLRAIAPRDLQTMPEGEEVALVGFIDHDEHCELFGEPEPVPILDLEGQVVVITREIHRAISDSISQGEPALVLGTVCRHAHERYLRAHQVLPLERAERMSQGVRLLRLDLAREDRRTLKMLFALLKQYPGETPVELAAHPPDISRRLCAKIAQRRVHCSPPLVHALRRMLPPEAVACVRTAETAVAAA